MILTGENRSTRSKACPSATLSTTDLMWTDLGSNLRFRGERPVTNRLRHDATFEGVIESFFYVMFPDFRKGIAFWKPPRLRPFVFMVRAMCT
jgi:hypothetical protein